ncbi:hypothetical protein CBL22_23470 [Shigella flexneri]|nr:hypothetical protein CBW45_24425 [Shigella flexneri]OUZ80526.1 hypothetical protein CBL22_23470 [Shigella flexneri]
MNGLRNTFLRIYLCIFNRMKKTVNRSSKYIFLLFKTDLSWICPYISRHLLSLNPLQARCRRYSRGER